HAGQSARRTRAQRRRRRGPVGRAPLARAGRRAGVYRRRLRCRRLPDAHGGPAVAASVERGRPARAGAAHGRRPAVAGPSAAGRPAATWAGLPGHGRPIQYAHVPTPLELWDVGAPIAGPPVAFEAPSAGFAVDWQTLAAMRERGVAFATLTHAAGISSTGDVE